jgi:Domain of unknown function (DUF6968)
VYREVVVKLTGIGNQIAYRRMQWKGLPDDIVEVKVGQPQSLEESEDMYCPFEIRGTGREHLRYAVGIDAIQALALTVRMIRADLEALEAERGGQLEWAGGLLADFE